MILDANAVVDPRTVMIKSFYASMADTTMPTSTSSDDLALWAQLRGFEVLEQLHKVDIAVDNVAWIFRIGENQGY